MFGILNLDKPGGASSRDVVNHVQRLLRPAKVGHAGTLDPLATGVLIVCVGPATRLIGHVQQLPKQYSGTFLLGRSSPTEDTEGEIHELPHPPLPTVEEIAAVLPQFTGRILQTPPAFSALKVGGRRAYELARQQQEVKLTPRPIEVHRLELVAYDYPQLRLDIACGSGTYVRSLGRDIARALGTEAVMSALRRTAIGPFDVATAHAPASVTAESLPELLLPPLAALPDLPRHPLSPEQIEHLGHGTLLPDPFAGRQERIAAVDAQGRLQAILVPHSAGLLRPHPNFVHYWAEQ